MSDEATAVIVLRLTLDKFAAGDPSTELAREVVREFGQRVRHRLLAEGIRVDDVSAVLTNEPIGTPKP